MSEIAKLTPYEKRQQGLDKWAYQYFPSLDYLDKVKFMFLSSFMPSLDRVGEIAYRSKAVHEATITVLAIRRWQLEKGDYPDSLGQLVAGGYLKVLPPDPYSDGPLKYAKRGEDFVLYSIGADFEDGGGVRPAKSTAKSSFEKDGGDRVFWPLQD